MKTFCESVIPFKMPYLYSERIGEYLLVYKPRADHKFLLLDKHAQQIFFACDGKRNLEKIYDFLENHGYKQEKIEATIVALNKEKILKVSDEISGDISLRQAFKRTFGIWLHVTNNCNLRCSYCYIDKNKGNMPLHIAERTVINAVEQCGKFGIENLSIKFAGGEPLMVWENIKHIINFAKKCCAPMNITPVFSIISNGTLVKKEIAEYLKNNKISIGVSLDGLRVVNDNQRFHQDGRGSFNEVYNGICVLKKAGCRPFILITVTSNNANGLQELTRFLLEHELNFRYSFERNCSRLLSTDDLIRDSLMYTEILSECFVNIEEWMLRKQWNFNIKLCDINLDRPISRSCGIGKNSAAIDHGGRIALCQMVFNESIGHIGKIGLIEAIQNQQIIPELRKKTINDCLECSQCIWKNVCAGGCPVFTYKQRGAINLPSPYCKVFQTLIPKVVRLRGVKLIRSYEEQKGDKTWLP